MQIKATELATAILAKAIKLTLNNWSRIAYCCAKSASESIPYYKKATNKPSLRTFKRGKK